MGNFYKLRYININREIHTTAGSSNAAMLKGKCTTCNTGYYHNNHCIDKQSNRTFYTSDQMKPAFMPCPKQYFRFCYLKSKLTSSYLEQHLQATWSYTMSSLRKLMNEACIIFQNFRRSNKTMLISTRTNRDQKRYGCFLKFKSAARIKISLNESTT